MYGQKNGDLRRVMCMCRTLTSLPEEITGGSGKFQFLRTFPYINFRP